MKGLNLKVNQPINLIHSNVGKLWTRIFKMA